MMQLHQELNAFHERDTIVVAIGPEKEKSFQNYWEKNKLKFYGLPDAKHKVLKLFGQEVKLIKLGRLPAQMIVDKKGFLRYVHYGHSMKDIPNNEETLGLLDLLQSEEKYSST